MKKNGKRTTETRSPGDGGYTPQVCGGDIELGNFVLGGPAGVNSGALASRLLLREIDGHAVHTYGYAGAQVVGVGIDQASNSWQTYGSSDMSDDVYGSSLNAPNPQDWGRRYLPANGGCVYIDLDHLEICLPEVVGARDHTAAWFAMLRIARQAQVAANRRLQDGTQVRILVNNSDGLGHSFGSHLNFQVSRRVWRNLFRRKLHHMMYLAAYQVSSIIFTGAGKVGSENGRPEVDYQLSQRADYFETQTGMQTTFNRPLVNSRDEALCGAHGRTSWGREDQVDGLARLHVIFYDSNLCQMAHFLKIGVMQMVLAMIEAGRVDSTLVLDDPVDAVHRWSHDPGLTTRAALLSGEEVTALELQHRFLDEARHFMADDERAVLVPQGETILREWERTLTLLADGDLEPLSRRVDWALKKLVLDRVLSQRPDLDWASPEIKHLDQIYASLDPEEGLYWPYLRSGFVETVVDESAIDAFEHGPPENTRAWTRAMLLRRLGSRAIDHVDWDHIRLRSRGAYGLDRYHRIDMGVPASLTRADVAPLLDGARTLDDIITGFKAVEVNDRGQDKQRSWS